MNIYDKNGIPIARGDIVKVFHFTGARRKKHYMYKQCLGVVNLKSPYLSFSHLNFIEGRHAENGPYLIQIENQALEDYEIIQSIECDHEERERWK